MVSPSLGTSRGFQGMRRTKGSCAYCGVAGLQLEREHVIPRCLYPKSRSGSRTQRITVPACSACNRGYSDNEAHFRNVLLIAGEPNDAVQELWSTKTNPSFYEADGYRRLTQLFEQMESAHVDGQPRSIIYPAKDEKVKRVLRKIVYGLSYHHTIDPTVKGKEIELEILKFSLPHPFSFLYSEPGIVRYWYEVYDEGQVRSAWLLNFFDRLTFIARVREPENQTT
jgi:hypothetical protein